MATQYIIEQIKVENELKDLLAKTNGDNVAVVYNGQTVTLTAALASILLEIQNLPTGSGIDAKISAAIDELVGGADSTMDTLKELADLISTNKSAAEALSSAIGNKVDKVTGKGLSTNDFTDALLSKLNAIEVGATKTVIDDALSTTSTNPVQNKVINNALAQKAPLSHTHAAATQAAAGFMSAADKKRVDTVRGVRYGSSAPSDMLNGELFIRVVE